MSEQNKIIEEIGNRFSNLKELIDKIPRSVYIKFSKDLGFTIEIDLDEIEQFAAGQDLVV